MSFLCYWLCHQCPLHVRRKPADEGEKYPFSIWPLTSSSISLPQASTAVQTGDGCTDNDVGLTFFFLPPSQPWNFMPSHVDHNSSFSLPYDQECRFMQHDDHNALCFTVGWMKYIPLTGGAIAELSMHFVLCHARGSNSHIKVRVILSDPPTPLFHTPARNLTVFGFIERLCLACITCL